MLKLEEEDECCALCCIGTELTTFEEYDAGAPPMQPPLRSMLLHLNNNKVVTDGKICGDCIRRAVDAYEFSTSLSSRSAPPLSEKIRSLRRKLHELTQKIDVFIVVGGPGVNSSGTYNEDDIIMVEKDALAAATAADDEDMERAKNAKGETVFQCSICPQSFQRAVDFRSHLAQHGAGAAAGAHSCWTCGAQFATRAALRDHAASHEPQEMLCNLCNTVFQSPGEMRRHEASCSGTGSCSVCRRVPCGARATWRRTRRSATRAPRPRSAPGCAVAALPAPPALAAHLLRHRQARQYVCGYDGCILRFTTRWVSEWLRHSPRCPRRPRWPRTCCATGRRASTCAATTAASCGSPPVAAALAALPAPPALAAHLLRHRQARQYVCGYDGCILRFTTRWVSEWLRHSPRCPRRPRWPRTCCATGRRASTCAATTAASCGSPPGAPVRVRLRRLHPAVHHQVGEWLRHSPRCPRRPALAAHLLRHRQARQYVCGYDGCILRFTTRWVSEWLRHSPRCPRRPRWPRTCCATGRRASTCAATTAASCGSPPVAAALAALPAPPALAAHLLRHRQARQYVCGYDGCILRFTTRGNLMAHIRKCHAAPVPEEPGPPPTTCPHCLRSFGSVAAMKRHARVHKRTEDIQEQDDEMDMKDAGEIEYLEVDNLE
ncbi:hypothetical protein ACJJTC_016480 [Scirpophaga incertulas]